MVMLLGGLRRTIRNYPKHYGGKRRLVTSDRRVEGIEVAHQPLQSLQVSGKYGVGLFRLQLRLTAFVPHHTSDRGGVEAGASGYLLGERDVVGRRLRAVQAQKRAEHDHHRAHARREQVELTIAVVARG